VSNRAQRPGSPLTESNRRPSLADLIEWLDQFTRAVGWQRRLDALETEVYRAGRERRRRGAADQRQENTA